METTLLKNKFSEYAKQAYQAHEAAKSQLLNSMGNRTLTGHFGQANIDTVLRTESLVNQLVFDLDYIKSEEFASWPDDDFCQTLVDIRNGLRARAREYHSKGHVPRDAWVLSGISEFLVFLDDLLN